VSYWGFGVCGPQSVSCGVLGRVKGHRDAALPGEPSPEVLRHLRTSRHNAALLISGSLALVRVLGFPTDVRGGRLDLQMGHELWTSPITGYRRRGTRLSELRALLGSGITAHAILEPLQSCPADAPAPEMAEVLKRRDFDVAGVQSERAGSVIGFVLRESLNSGVVSDHRQPLTADLLISEATPLPSVFAALRNRRHAFVLMGPEVRGIVTTADLNKPAVRVYLFGLVSLLEMHLSFWIRAVYPTDSWHSGLGEARLAKAKQILEDRQGRGQEIGLLECVQFCDKRMLVIARSDLREKLDLGSKTSAEARLKLAEEMRDLLAHSQQDLVQGSSWQEQIDLIEWIDRAVHRSDQYVEEHAKSGKGLPESELWESA
jgi:hypothetical protein